MWGRWTQSGPLLEDVIARPFLSYQKEPKRVCMFLECYWQTYKMLFLFTTTSFGDKDLDMRLSNPLHLRTLLEDKRFSKCRIVLLHASYPFSKEASYLASVYPQVKFSPQSMKFLTCPFEDKLGSSHANKAMLLLSGVPRLWVGSSQA